MTGSVSLTGHLIPEFVIGIELGSGKASIQSEFALSLDASATLSMNDTAGVLDSSNSTAVIVPGGTCVDVSTALDVSAGVDIQVAIFEDTPSVSLFDRSFDLYNVSLIARPDFHG